MKKKMVDWSSLPMDAIEFISTRLSNDADYVLLRAVCTSWCSAAPKRPHLPWLIVAHPVNDGVSAIERHDVFFGLLNLPNTTDISWLLHQPGQGIIHDKLICGSSRFWLAILDDSLGISLHNPFTGFTVSLPNLNYRIFEDIIFYKGQFYAVSGLRVDGCHTLARHDRAIAILPTNPSISVFQAQKKYERNGIQSYLVVSSGDLLLASISYGVYIEEIKCDVFRIDLDAGQLRLIKQKNLGGRALFLGDKSMSISTAPSAWCKTNCIYYSCQAYKKIPHSRWRAKNGYPRKNPQGTSVKMCQNISIFNMKDRKTSSIPSLPDHFFADYIGLHQAYDMQCKYIPSPICALPLIHSYACFANIAPQILLSIFSKYSTLEISLHLPDKPNKEKS